MTSTPKTPGNVVLVGFMGTGKTTAGKRLADRLGMEFVDMDERIEQQVGRPIPAIFADKGERYFRALERQLVRELSARSNLVIAAGGGVVLDASNIADFETTGVVICLSAKPETLLARVAHDSRRPLLAGPDRMARILKLLESRRDAYRAIRHQVDTTGLDTKQVVERILALCETAPTAPN